MGWLVDDADPESWRTVVWDQGRRWRVYDCGMVEFVCRLLLAERENPLDVPLFFKEVSEPRARHWRTLLAQALSGHDTPWSPPSVST